VIDVLLPFYGDPELLYLAVDSILGQTEGEFRLVVVDDGYPDPAVAAWFAALDDPRVEYHRNETNLGANANYTRALELASAEHIVVMGADDVMLPNYLSTITSTLQRFPGADVIQCGVQVIDGEGEAVAPVADRVKGRVRPSVHEPTLLVGEDLLVSLLRGNWTYFPSLCWRTDAVRAIGFRPQFHVVQDMALLVDIILGGGGLALVPEVAFRYRRHQGSDSAVKTLTGSRFEEERNYFELIGTELERRGLRRAARAARRHLTSRLHAAALLPTAARSRDTAALARLLRHATR
jgi:glycosyltransferase involved in cell wall biosynthesis